MQTRSQRSRAGLAPGHKLTTVGHCARLCVAERAVYWDAVSPRIWAICALLPPFFGLFVHTRRDTHTCMQCAAACGCLEERERRERAIPLVFYATAARMLGGGRVQNSGPLSSHVMFLGV